MAYFNRDIDFEILDPEKFHETSSFEYMNLPCIYMVAALAGSQSMSKLGSGFKTVKQAESIMSKTFPSIPGGSAELDGASGTPYITRQTVAYAISLSVSCIYYAANNEANKGRAD